MTRELVTIPSGTYAVRPADVAYARYSWAAARLAAWCARDLYLGPLRIAWYIDPEPISPSAQRRGLRGYVIPDEPGLIHVRADQSEVETLRSTAHESYHLHEYRENRVLDEERAEAYGRRAANDYLARRIQ